MSTVLEKESSAATEDALDLVCQLHDQAGQHLKSFRDTHRKMLATLASAFGSNFQIPVASSPAATKEVESNGEATASVLPKKGAAAAASEEKKKVAPAERNYNNDLSLRETVWSILSRKENKKGLRVAQIIEIIEKEGIWKTEGELNNMVHGTVYALKKDEMIERGYDKTYRIVPGAKLGS